LICFYLLIKKINKLSKIHNNAHIYICIIRIKKKCIIVCKWGERGVCEREQLTLNYYGLLQVRSFSSFYRIFLERHGVKVQEVLTFRFLSSLRVLLEAKSIDNKQRYRLSHTAIIRYSRRGNIYTLPLKLVSMWRRVR